MHVIKPRKGTDAFHPNLKSAKQRKIETKSKIEKTILLLICIKCCI